MASKATRASSRTFRSKHDLRTIQSLFREEFGDWSVEDQGDKLTDEPDWSGYAGFKWEGPEMVLLAKKLDQSTFEIVVVAVRKSTLKRMIQVLMKLDLQDKVWLIRKVLSAYSEPFRLKKHEDRFNLRIVTFGLSVSAVTLLLQNLGYNAWVIIGIHGVMSGFLWGTYRYAVAYNCIDLRLTAEILMPLSIIYVIPVSIIFYFAIIMISLAVPYLWLQSVAVFTIAAIIVVPSFTVLHGVILPRFTANWRRIRKDVDDSVRKSSAELKILEDRVSYLSAIRSLPVLFVAVFLVAYAPIAAWLSTATPELTTAFVLAAPIVTGLVLIQSHVIEVGWIAMVQEFFPQSDEFFMIYLDGVPMRIRTDLLLRTDSPQLVVPLNFRKEAPSPNPKSQHSM